jgi:hypothetical protein
LSIGSIHFGLPYVWIDFFNFLWEGINDYQLICADQEGDEPTVVPLTLTAMTAARRAVAVGQLNLF